MILEKKKIFIIKRHNNYLFFSMMYLVIKMKVKIFDESHEKDLEDNINSFLEEKNPDIIDIKYSVSNSIYSEEQIYCFSALIMYQNKND